MGHAAEDAYEMGLDTIYDEISYSMPISTKQLKQDANDVLNHEYYIENEYTNMIRDIIDQDNLIDKQKKALYTHISVFYEELL